MIKKNTYIVNNIILLLVIVICSYYLYCNKENEMFDFKVYNSPKNSPSSSPRGSPSSSSRGSPSPTPISTPSLIPISTPIPKSEVGGNITRLTKNISQHRTPIRNNIVINNKIRNNDNDYNYPPDNIPYTYGQYPYPVTGYTPYFNYYPNYYSNYYPNINTRDDILPYYRDTYNGNFVDVNYPRFYRDWCWGVVSYRDFNLVPTSSRSAWVKQARRYGYNHILLPRDRTDFILVPTTDGSCALDKFGDPSMFEEIYI